MSESQKRTSSSSGAPRERPTSTRQLLRQQRELEEKRKFGLAPLAIDTVSQKEISPNIPQSIAQAPWYYGASGPTLDHQRKHDPADGNTLSEDLRLQENHDKVVVLGHANKFVAGACRNCGSRTHKTHECIQAKKKVGARFTNKVTGEDIVVKRAERADGQKRDRFVGDVGVDLLRGQPRSGGSDNPGTDEQNNVGTEEDGDAAPRDKRIRSEDIFGARSAQHGGMEIQELPKYLQNLDQQADVYFDPKTGSMRGNPNAADPTRAFQGDLERYRSGDFYNYVEAQHRYLTGKSKSFVDFALDKELNAERGVRVEDLDKDSAHAGGNTKEGGSVAAPFESAHEALVKALYGETAASTVAVPASSLSAATAAVTASSHASITTTPPSASTASRETNLPTSDATQTTVSSSTSVHEQLVRLTALAVTAQRSSGHTAIYGSYLDSHDSLLRWGYACCKRLGKEAPGCQQGK